MYETSYAALYSTWLHRLSALLPTLLGFELSADFSQQTVRAAGGRAVPMFLLDRIALWRLRVMTS